jgi:CRP-like cAMP-binding protein
VKDSISELKYASLIYSLAHCRLFTGLPEEELSEIAALTSVESVDKGGFLFKEGDPSRGFFLVQKGVVSLHRVNPAGKEQVIHIFREGDSFGEASLATELGYPANARCVEDSQFLVVEKQGFIGLLARRADLSLRMLTAMAVHLHQLVGQIDDLTLKDIETRLANWVLKRCPDAAASDPFSFRLTTTKQVLAAELGTISATLSRTIARLREQDLVEVRGKSITVPSPAQLGAFLRDRLGG